MRAPIPHRRAVVGLAAFTLLALAASAPGCRDNLDATVTNACPDQEAFQVNVSPFLERRCGTLDCHGGIARPMRIFGQLGLRHPSEINVSGGAPTTGTELTANYESVCNVDSEKMAESVTNFGNTAEELLIITKARGFEKHKGGKVVNENDSGDRCLLLWLKGNGKDDANFKGACEDALKQLD